MPNQKTKTEMPKRASKASGGPPASAGSSPQDLAGWIKHLEDELRKNAPVEAELVLEKMRQSSETCDSWCWRARDRQQTEKFVGDLPQEATFPEALQDRLQIVWSDPKFWLLIRELPKVSPPPPHTIDDYCRSYIYRQHQLVIPFPASMWQEMVREPIQRAYIFQLMVCLAPRFFPTGTAAHQSNLARPAGDLLPEQELGLWLHRYVHFPGQDWRPSLALDEFSEQELKLLRAGLARMLKDVSYLIKYPGRFDARRAPPVAHRTRTLEEAHHVEQMVVKLRQQPDLADYSLAKQYFGSDNANKRKLAGEARKLAYYRDQIPVTFHRSKGKKPGSA